MSDEMLKRLAVTLNLVKPDAGNALMHKSGNALMQRPSPGLSPEELSRRTDETLDQYAERLRRALGARRNIPGRSDKYQRKMAKLEVQLAQLERKNPRKAERIRKEIEKLRADMDAYAEEMTRLNNDVEDIVGRITSIQDIGIRVGFVAYSAQKGSIPIYPIIECDFPTSAGRPVLGARLFLSCEGRRYKVYEPGHDDQPFAECDQPVDQETHETFQRLCKLWDCWYLRVNGDVSQQDYMVLTGNVDERHRHRVMPLDHPVETSLSLLSQSKDAILEACLDPTSPIKYKDVASFIDCCETLVGPLPVPSASPGLITAPGLIAAWVVHKLNNNGPINAQWVQLQQDKLVDQLRDIIGGQFFSAVYENSRTGVNFVQIIPQEGVRGPDIWLRAVPLYQGRSMGRTQVIPTIGNSLPLEEFDPIGVMSLQADDVTTVKRRYHTEDGRDNGMVQAKRIQVLPEESQREVDKRMHGEIIANYLQLCQTLRVAVMTEDANALKIWPHFRDAVIFELPPVAYTSLFDEFLRYCVKSARVDADIPLRQHSMKQRRRVYSVIEGGRHAPFPEQLPFKSCFFAYGGGAPDVTRGIMEVERNKPGERIGRLYGHLVTSSGMVVGFRHFFGPDGKEGFVYTFDRDPSNPDLGEQWDRPHTLAPWIINALVNYVNEHKKLVEQGKHGLAYQQLVKKTSKRISYKAPVPPPFYVVYLKDEFIREEVRQRSSVIKRHIDWQHRWKVRGHDCIRFQRGPLPIDPDLEEQLQKRRYKIFTDTQPDAETFADLLKRGVRPKRDDEWIAILKYWRNDFEKGPADKPLIESVRRAAKDWSP